MKPAVKYGIVGGIMALLLLIIGYNFVANNTAISKLLQYAVQLVLLVAVVLSIRQMDAATEGPIELKAGLRSGLTTTLIIAICMSAFTFSIQQFTPKNELLKQVNESINRQLEKEPVKVKANDSVSFNKTVVKADSSEKVENYIYAKYMLERAARMGNNNEKIASRLVLINNRMLESISSPLYHIKIMVPYFIFQLLIGMVISFVFTLLLRLKQHNA